MVFLVMMMRVFKRLLGGVKGVAALDGVAQLRARERVPVGGNDHGVCVLRAAKRHGGIHLFARELARVRENDGACVCDLVTEKFTEILHIHLALARVHDGDKRGDLQMLVANALHGAHHVGKLADAGWLDEDAVGFVFVKHLDERAAEIAHQRAADAARVHLGDVDARVREKPAVHADLTELVFDQHEFFARVGFLDQLFDQRGLTRAEKAGKNINFGHDLLLKISP